MSPVGIIKILLICALTIVIPKVSLAESWQELMPDRPPSDGSKFYYDRDHIRRIGNQKVEVRYMQQRRNIRSQSGQVYNLQESIFLTDIDCGN